MTTLTVVVVQHQPADGAALQQALAARGYQVLVLDAGARAHTVIRQQQPAAVVLDIDAECPQAAWKVLQLLWLDRATLRIPLVVCVPPPQLVAARAAGLHQRGVLLEKPCALAALLASVQAAADGGTRPPARTDGDEAEPAAQERMHG